MNKQLHRLTLILLVLAGLLAGRPAVAEGSRDLYPNGAQGSRANLEWRTNTYAGLLLRRTLLKVYANAGEYICVGSSAVGVGSGDALIYDANGVYGPVGGEQFYAPVFQAKTAEPGRGTITSRTQELAGPQAISGGGNPSGYAPAYYQATASGIYTVVFYGPSGGGGNSDGSVSSDVALTNSGDFSTGQATSIAAWDVTVRSSDTTSTADLTGRLFADYLALFTGGNSRPLYPTVYAATLDGYQYRIDLRGLDPNGFILYGNQVGFLDSDGFSPLYHDILGGDGQVSSPAGGVSLSLPNYPVFFHLPDSGALGALGIPLSPIAPAMTNLAFAGNLGGNNSRMGGGGTFSFTANIAAVYQIVISRDGSDFDPTNPNNRLLRGVGTAGGNSVSWDGKDNSGAAFPVGTNYAVHAEIHGGEYHFPMLDAENDLAGGPTFTLLNASNPLGNTTAFYDDRGYRTANGTYVTYSSTTTASSNNSALVGHILGGLNPPATAFSNPLTGFDTSGTQRAYGNYGNTNGGNSNQPNIGSFGDTKGLDIWTYTPSSATSATLNVLPAATPTVLLVKRITAVNGVDVAGFADDPGTTADNNPDWPSPAATFLRGGLAAAGVKPGDVVDYTIYFLVTGGAAGSFTLCDQVPANMTLLPDAYNGQSPTDGGLAGTDYGIALGSSAVAPPTAPTVYLSDVADSDRGQFYAPGTAAPAAANPGGGFSAPLPGAQNASGVVAVTVVTGAGTLPAATGPGSPANSYGFVRFRAQVK